MSDLVYKIRHASDVFDRVETTVRNHLTLPMNAGPDDLVGVLFYVQSTETGIIDAWTARKYVLLDHEGAPNAVSFDKLPQKHQPAAAQISMKLLYDRPEHSRDLYEAFDNLQARNPSCATEKRDGMTYAVLIMRGLIYVAATHLDNGQLFEDMFRTGRAQEAIDDHRIVILPQAKSSHHCIELMQDYSPHATKVLTGAISCVAEIGRMKFRIKEVQLPNLAEAISDEHCSGEKK